MAPVPKASSGFYKALLLKAPPSGRSANGPTRTSARGYAVALPGAPLLRGTPMTALADCTRGGECLCTPAA